MSLDCPQCETPLPVGDHDHCPACGWGTGTDDGQQSEAAQPQAERAAATFETLRRRETALLSECARLFEASPLGEEHVGHDHWRLADQIEQELLPAYQTILARLADVEVPEGEEQAHRHVQEMVRKGEAAWTAIVEDLRRNDAAGFREHQEQWLIAAQALQPESGEGADPAADRENYRFFSLLHAITPRVWVTGTIVAVNVAIFLFMLARGVSPMKPTAEELLAWGANFGPRTLNGEPWRLLTSMFLHFGVIHIGFNMWILWDAGRLVERMVGNVGFLLMYLYSGLMGSLASLIWDPVAVGAGASGAVFGVFGALLGFVVLRSDSVPAELLRHFRRSVLTFLVFNLIIGLSIPGIGLAAHLGGMAAGFVCGLVLSQPLRVGMGSARLLRNAVLVVLAGVSLPAAFIMMPPAPPDIIREMNRFGEVEESVLAEYNSLVTRHQQGDLDDRDLARDLDQKVLAPWREERERLAALPEVRGVDPQRVQRIVKYMKLREESWQLLQEGVQDQDPEKIAEHRIRSQQADDFVRSLNNDSE